MLPRFAYLIVSYIRFQCIWQWYGPRYVPIWPPIAQFIATPLRSLLRNFAPAAVSRSLRLSLGARRLLAQTTAFAHLLGGLGARAFGPAVELESPSPFSLGARCLLAQTTAFARCRDSSSNSVVHTIVIYKGSSIKPPATRSTSEKYQSIVTQKIQQKFLHIGKWSCTPKYYTTHCAGSF